MLESHGEKDQSQHGKEERYAIVLPGENHSLTMKIRLIKAVHTALMHEKLFHRIKEQLIYDAPSSKTYQQLRT